MCNNTQTSVQIKFRNLFEILMRIKVFFVHILVIESLIAFFTKEPILPGVAGQMIFVVLFADESFGTIFSLVL